MILTVLKPKYYRVDRLYQIERAKKWNRENAERRKKNYDNWYNKPKVREQRNLLASIYYFTHKHQASQYQKSYVQANRKKVNQYQRKYQKNKYHTDKQFKLDHLERCRIYREKNREKIRERNRLYYQRNRSK